MQTTLTMFRASLLSIVRDRQTLIGAMIFPTVFLLAFAAFDIGLTDGGIGTSGGGVDYFTFVVPGILAMSSLQFSVFWTSGSYARMGETKVLRRLEATPIPRGAFLAGQVMARLIIVAVQASIVIGVGVLLGASIAGNPVLMILLTIVAATTFLSVGFAIGARASNVDSANMMAGMTVMPLVFLSGAWFPISGLPGWLESVMEVLPLAPLLEAMRAVAIQGAGIADIGGNLAQVAMWIPVTFAIAVVAMRPRRTAVRTRSTATQQAEAAA
jgi:ABC-2 type transport system permease protein